MGVILLMVIPVALVICFCLFMKMTGLNIIPKELQEPTFQMPKIKRVPGKGWTVD